MGSYNLRFEHVMTASRVPSFLLVAVVIAVSVGLPMGSHHPVRIPPRTKILSK